MEDLDGLHHLSSVMKTLSNFSSILVFCLTLVLINDVVIIEPIVGDDLILGVAGILECTYSYSYSLDYYLLTP
jgi:Component of IIS longevity pathway SMK-1